MGTASKPTIARQSDDLPVKKSESENGLRPEQVHRSVKGDKPGHHDNADDDRMHSGANAHQAEKANRPFHAKDQPKGADQRRGNPDRDRAGNR